jgi:branched-chain amino acid transport system permease protein
VTELFGAIVAGVTDGAVFGLMALGLVLVYKATRVLNFAQGEIGTFSIYVAWMVSSPRGEVMCVLEPPLPFVKLSIPLIGMGMPVLIGTVAAMAVGGLLGVGMERIAIRPIMDAPKVTLTVVTLGVSTILGGLQFAICTEQPRSLPHLVPGSGPLVAGVLISPGRILALLVTAGLGGLLYLFFKRTMFGLGVLAAAQNAVSLRLTGIPLTRVSKFTWGAAGVLAALAGVILAPTIGAFHPFFMTLILIPSLAAALVGGMTSLPGAFVGGIAVGVLQAVVRQVWSSSLAGVEILAAFLLILGVLLFRPRGLLGTEA